MVDDIRPSCRVEISLSCYVARNKEQIAEYIRQIKEDYSADQLTLFEEVDTGVTKRDRGENQRVEEAFRRPRPVREASSRRANHPFRVVMILLKS
jgi:hypothetical protein